MRRISPARRIQGEEIRHGKKSGFAHRRTRRRRLRTFGIVALLLIVAGTATYANVRADKHQRSVLEGKKPSIGEGVRRVNLASTPLTAPLAAPRPPDPTITGVAYEALAAGLPNADISDMRGARQSISDPAWASVRLPVPGRNDRSYYAVFLQRSDGEWTARRSVLVEGQDHPRDVTALIENVPDDLVRPLVPPEDAPEPADSARDRALQVVRLATDRPDAWVAEKPETSGAYHRVEVRDRKDPEKRTAVYLKGEGDDLEVVATGRDLTTVELRGFPPTLAEKGAVWVARPATPKPPTLVRDGQTDLAEAGLDDARRLVEDYPGTAGFYAIDLTSGAGYGVRPDEAFFSASTIKVAVMVSVYRRIDEGKLSYSDGFETQEGDWAAGAGWLRWDTPGAKTTVEDALWLMMTQSDNVATNALTRMVGGPDYVNEVARSLGAQDTVLYWKLSSERAVVPTLDNRTTPRDMATMLQKIYKQDAASDRACDEMRGLLEQNQLEYWMEAGVPQGIPVANKAGWLDAVFNDAGIVEYKDRPYVLATFTKYGPEEMKGGAPILQGVSAAVWHAESGKTVEDYEKAQEKKED